MFSNLGANPMRDAHGLWYNVIKQSLSPGGLYQPNDWPLLQIILDCRSGRKKQWKWEA